MSPPSRVELILSDFSDTIENVDIKNKYTLLYSDVENLYAHIFAYFHQSFTELFDFINRKNRINKHVNAAESRALIDLIDQYQELRDLLKKEGVGIVLSSIYENNVEICKKFLKSSGGSELPNDFELLATEKYEKIFELANSTIKIKSKVTNQELKLIGEGAFSIVQKYTDPTYQKSFAVKQLKKTHTDRDLTRFKDEYTIMKELNFPYILEVYSYDDENNRYTMEYCETTLNDFMVNNNSTLPFTSRKKLAQQFIYGLNYLHKKGYLHRDLSYRNILLRLYDGRAGIIKLSDFGLVKSERSEFTKSETEIKGTIIDPLLESFKNYNVKNEIYAVGFILSFIFTGKKSLPKDAGKLKEIVSKCTNSDLEKRYENITGLMEDIDLLTEGS